MGTSKTSAPISPSKPPSNIVRHTTPTIGVALGGGGARGLAHIPMLEAFDELGIRPKVIAGTSIGAIYGAAYASGISGKELRAHTELVLSQRFGLVRDLFAARAQPFQRVMNLFAARSALLDPDALLDLVMPKGLAKDFESLDIPLKIVASDFYDQEPYIFTTGALRPAVAASMALPVIFRPVIHDGKTLIDGGLTNPLPFDLLFSEADIVVAIDVSGAPVPDPKRAFPTVFDSLFASAFIFERSIVKEKLKWAQPDILVSSGTSQYQVLDFLKFNDIFASAEPAKERLKAQLMRVLSVETLALIETREQESIAVVTTPQLEKPKRRGLLRRRKSKSRS